MRIFEGSTSAADVEGPFGGMSITPTGGAAWEPSQMEGPIGHDIPKEKSRTKQIGWGRVVICGGLKAEPWVKLSGLK